MSNFIPLSVPNIKGNELKYITRAIESEWVSTAGEYIVQFEREIAKYLNIDGAVACQSGTAGLHLALECSNVGVGDEVIVSTLTFIAAVNPIKYVGAEPIFMDCNDELTIDCKKLRRFCENECEFINGKLINRLSRKHIKAIVIVHVFGNISNMIEITDIAKKFNLKIIEDATEALGSVYTEGKYKGKFAGTIGDIGVFSFNGNKIITTGGGGMVVSKDKDMLTKCKYLSTQAKDDDVYFDHKEIGYNYRMTNVQAAIGLGQIEKIEEFINMKQRNYERYKQNKLKLLPFSEGVRPNFWFYSYITERRDDLIVYLEKRKIQTRPIWKLIHTLKPYENNQAYDIKNAYYYYDRIVNIPCSSNLSLGDVDRVSEEIKKFEVGEGDGIR